MYSRSAKSKYQWNNVEKVVLNVDTLLGEQNC